MVIEFIISKERKITLATEQEIQKNIEKSTKLYRAQKEKAKEFHQYIKEGIAVITKNRIPVYRIDLDNNFRVSIGIKVDKYGYGVYSWAVCAPKDTFSKRIAKGLVGNRIKSYDTRSIDINNKTESDIIFYIITKILFITSIKNIKDRDLGAMSNRFKIFAQRCMIKGVKIHSVTSLNNLNIGKNYDS